MLCSQVFLSPVQSNSLSRSSMNSNHNTNNDFSSFDTSSLNSITLSLSVCVGNALNQMDESKNDQASTNPLDMPPNGSTTESLDGSRSFTYSGYDSGYGGIDPWTTSYSSCYPRSTRSSIASVYSSHGSRKFSMDSSIAGESMLNGSDGCLQRRILRNLSTSFENHLSGSDFIGYFGDNIVSPVVGGSDGCVTMARRYSDQPEVRSNPEMGRRRKTNIKDNLRPPPAHHSNYSTRTKSSNRRSKIGLAVCITISESTEDEMQVFCSEHIALLESMLCRLRATAENAYVNQKRFHQLMLHAWISTTAWLTDLFTAPRLPEPVWLTLSTGASDNLNSLAQRFMGELCWLLSCADTKDTNL